MVERDREKKYQNQFVLFKIFFQSPTHANSEFPGTWIYNEDELSCESLLSWSTVRTDKFSIEGHIVNILICEGPMISVANPHPC